MNEMRADSVSYRSSDDIDRSHAEFTCNFRIYGVFPITLFIYLSILLNRCNRFRDMKSLKRMKL